MTSDVAMLPSISMTALIWKTFHSLHETNSEALLQPGMHSKKLMLKLPLCSSEIEESKVFWEGHLWEALPGRLPAWRSW